MSRSVAATICTVCPVRRSISSTRKRFAGSGDRDGQRAFDEKQGQHRVLVQEVLGQHRRSPRIGQPRANAGERHPIRFG